jgi:NitT/TauT family transport system substrate-binding protein
VRAQAAGYFAAEGLTVELVTVQGGAAALPRLATGDLDLTFTNYVSALLGQAQGKGHVPVRRRRLPGGPEHPADHDQAGSAIRTPADLAGKKIAVNTLRNIVELTARSALETAGVDPGSVTFVEVPFPTWPPRCRAAGSTRRSPWSPSAPRRRWRSGP